MVIVNVIVFLMALVTAIVTAIEIVAVVLVLIGMFMLVAGKSNHARARLPICSGKWKRKLRLPHSFGILGYGHSIGSIVHRVFHDLHTPPCQGS